jgi:hypothetical protein
VIPCGKYPDSFNKIKYKCGSEFEANVDIEMAISAPE